MKNATIITMTFATLLTAGLMSGTAAAADCKNIIVSASGESAGAVGKFRMRRAERRAKKAWERKVAHHYGKKFADMDDAKHYEMASSFNARGNTVVTVIGQPCED